MWQRDDLSVQIAVALPDGRFLDVHLARGPIAGNPNIGRDPTTPHRGAIDRIDLTDDDALRVVEEMHVGPEPAYEWNGQR